MPQQDPASPTAKPLTVSQEEGGMKLLRFLERRLGEQVSRSLLHKWIRSGQVRVNKGRSGPFRELSPGDIVRLPPFAGPGAEANPVAPSPTSLEENALRLGPGLRLHAHTDALLVLAKGPGLASQPGSGNPDSVASRLRSAFHGLSYLPAPAHRLDKETSGLLLVGRSHQAQRRLQTLFAHNGVGKEYLAWVVGDWPQTCPCLLLDVLRKKANRDGYERMAAEKGGQTVPLEGRPARIADLRGYLDQADGAACMALAVARLGPEQCDPELFEADRPGPETQGRVRGPKHPGPEQQQRVTAAPSPGAMENGATLLLIRLFSGRKHQIRVQLASRGFPVIGDPKYGGPPAARLFLHAFALTVPELGNGPLPQECTGLAGDRLAGQSARTAEHTPEGLPGLLSDFKAEPEAEHNPKLNPELKAEQAAGQSPEHCWVLAPDWPGCLRPNPLCLEQARRTLAIAAEPLLPGRPASS